MRLDINMKETTFTSSQFRDHNRTSNGHFTYKPKDIFIWGMNSITINKLKTEPCRQLEMQGIAYVAMCIADTNHTIIVMAFGIQISMQN